MTSQRRLERWIGILRLSVVPFAVLQVVTSTGAPHGYRIAGWVITVIFVVGALVIFQLSSVELSARKAFRLSIASQFLDTAVVSGYVITYSVERSSLSPETLFIPLVEACVRFATLGGIVIALISVPVVTLFGRLHFDRLHQPFRYDYVGIHTGIEVLMALIVGGLAQRLRIGALEAEARAEEAVGLRDELARRVDVLDAANRCARALGSSLELREAFGSFIRELSGLIPFDRVAIVLAEDGLAQVMATAGAGSETTFPAGSRAPLDGTILEELLIASQPIYRPQLEPDRFVEEGEFKRLGLGSRVAAPLMTGTKVAGMLSLLRREEDAFTPAEIELVGLLGRLVATTAQNIRAYDAERRTVDELRRLSTMRADFVSLVSHELRTPMASVIGSARTLQTRWRELTAEQRDAFLALIADETERLAGFISEVLDTSRIDAGTFSYTFSDLDLAGILEETVATASLGQDAVDVVARIPRALPTIRGDGVRLRQVIANLVDNAVKYSPEGAQVEVRATAVNGKVVVDVTDRGAGIEPEDQALIFEKFGRVVGTSKPGTGLGLYIARAIVEAHGGGLAVSSAPGQGATFTLTLPVS